MDLRLHRYLPVTHVDGPGARAGVWVQGCPIRCAGCAVPCTWPPDGGSLTSVEELAAQILRGPEVEGVSLLGGEPFAQAPALAELAKAVRGAHLSVVVFTGYEIEFIRRCRRAGWRELLALTDLLIDGPYVAELEDYSRPWVGSSNKRYHFLTDRYRDLEGRLSEIPNRVEVRISPDGRILMNGMGRLREIEHDLFEGVARRAPGQGRRAAGPGSRGAA